MSWCAQATDSACPKACLETLRQGRSRVRTGRKGCVDGCRSQARDVRTACRAGEPEDGTECLRGVSKTKQTCLRGCDASATAGFGGRAATVEDCMATCAGIAAPSELPASEAQ